MKNKKLTYFLIMAVAAVWGLVIYRFINAAGADDDTPPVAVTERKEAFNDFSITKDTMKLLLNYRDPFGLVKLKDTNDAKAVRKVVFSEKAVTAPATNWSFITYSGYVRNPVSKKLVTLMTINGQSFALKEGETREQVRLVKNRLDSIEVAYQGKTKFIVKR